MDWTCTRDRHEIRGKSSRQGIGGSCKKHAELEEGYMCARYRFTRAPCVERKRVARTISPQYVGVDEFQGLRAKGLESRLVVALP